MLFKNTCCLKNIQRASLTITLAISAISVFFIFIVIMMNTSDQASRFSRSTEYRLKAKYMAESAFEIAIVELADNRHRLKQIFKSGPSDALENLRASEFGLEEPYNFKCVSLDIISMNTKGFSDDSLGIIAKITVEGSYENKKHRVSRTVQF